MFDHASTTVLSEAIVKDASREFDAYRQRWPARAPNLSNKRFDDEMADLTASPWVLTFSLAPMANVATTISPAVGTDTDKYLWLVRVSNIALALEHGDLGKSTTRGRLSHTNLSGSEPAHCGGEAWFRDAHSIFINGGSSRFTARSAEELDDVVQCFARCGYYVCSYGWDEELQWPNRALRNEQWISPITS